MDPIEQIIDFLNTPRPFSAQGVSSVLQKHELCKLTVSFGESDKTFALGTRKEISSMRDDGLDIGNILRTALHSSIEPKSYLASVFDSAVFFDDIDESSGATGEERFLEAFGQTFTWFEQFMASCEAGKMNVSALNKYKATRHISFAFTAPPNNPMNPMLTPDEMGEPYDERLESVLLVRFVYPILFGNKGRELTKIKRCLFCGTYFLAKRLSATFCSDTCRGGYHYHAGK
ncbi:hypothetical protein LJC46_03275 [Desulfovibrio sp. OttesenSCG-928-G15]|nr:hypothetical protein [Desulfovibrio sp. OttesenSCG-928-G15]